VTKLLPGGPVEIDITPSWWLKQQLSLSLYARGAAVLHALASPDLEVELKGCGAEVSIGVDGVTLRYQRPEAMTDKVLRRQRLTIMGALEDARPDVLRGGHVELAALSEQMRRNSDVLQRVVSSPVGVKVANVASAAGLNAAQGEPAATA
jgi:hypothetical protein